MMLRLVLFICLLFGVTQSEAKQTICLNMIVKNESKVIKRCLDSVIPLIDYWVIVDTGSRDGTQKIIKKHLKNIPGKLHQRPWKNFGHNRSEAFELAKGKADYILFIDADDFFRFDAEVKLPELTADLYHMWRGIEGFSYMKPQLVRANLPWKWVGVTHEYLDCAARYTTATLTGARYVSGDGGASSYDPEKFWRNVRLLTQGLKEEPNNSRYAFYLAESYKDAGDKAKALEWYQKTIQMGSWDEEIFWAKLQIGHMLRALGLPSRLVIESYKLAHEFRPHRAEPIYYLCDVYLEEGRHAEAYALLKAGVPVNPFGKDTLFNEDWIQDYGLLFQLSICAFYVGEYQEALSACDQLLLKGPKLPEHWLKQTLVNRQFPIAQLMEQNGQQPIHAQPVSSSS